MLQRLIKRSKSGQAAKTRLQQIIPTSDEQGSGELESGLQIEVNLLPREYKPESPSSLRNVLFLIISFLVLASLTLNVIKTVDREKELKQQNQKMLQVLNKYRQLKHDIDELKDRTALLHQRRNLLVNVIGERKTWADKLSQVYVQIPGNVWLSEISLDHEKLIISQPKTETKPTQNKNEKNTLPPVQPQEQLKLHIVGDAKDLAHIAEFIDRLEELSFLQQTQLHWVNQRETTTSARSKAKSDSFMSFEIVTEVLLEDG